VMALATAVAPTPVIVMRAVEACRLSPPPRCRPLREYASAFCDCEDAYAAVIATAVMTAVVLAVDLAVSRAGSACAPFCDGEDVCAAVIATAVMQAIEVAVTRVRSACRSRRRRLRRMRAGLAPRLRCMRACHGVRCA
jgi:hypothetical protein